MSKTKIDIDRLSALHNEIKMSVTINKEELEPTITEAVQRYTGKHVPEYGNNWDIVLNEVYPIIQNKLPSIFFRNPRAFLKPRNKTFIAKKRNPMTGQMETRELDSSKSAKTQEHILNYTLGEIKYKTEVRKVLLDALLAPYAVLWHGYKGNFGMTEEQSLYIRDEQVFVKRLAPTHFLYDPAVNISTIDEARWVGRVIEIPLQDLVEDDKLDVDKELVKGFRSFGNKVGRASESSARKVYGGDYVKGHNYKKPLLSYTDSEYQNSALCKFVRLYEIFLRPTKKEAREGKKGQIILLTDQQEKPLRVSDWSIKAEGFPAKILEFNGLNDDMFGINDVDTYKYIADQKNILANQQLRNAQETGKVWVALSKEGANEEDIEAIQDGRNTILTFDSGSVRDRMAVISPSGSASQELYLMQQFTQRNLDEKSGESDLRRGFLQSGEESATSVKLRSAGGGARPAYRQDIMTDFLKSSLHYINQLLKQFMPVKDAVRIIGSLDLEWSENPTKEEIQADTDVEIDAISMLPENPEKELEEFNSALSLLIQGLTDPVISQQIAKEGKTIELSPLVEQILLRLRINNPDIFRSIKPEESEGYVSVQQMRQARANVDAALIGQQPPHPPNLEDDHMAKLEVYSSINQLLQKAGQVSDTLEALIQQQSVLLQQQQEQQARPNQKVNLKPAKTQVI